MRKRMVILFCCIGIITYLVSGCGDDSKEAAMSESNLTKENVLNEEEIDNKIKVSVSNNRPDDYSVNSLLKKREIKISDGNSYFAMILSDGGFGENISLVPIPYGNGKFVYIVQDEEDFQPKFEIGALFEMKNPTDLGLEIDMKKIKIDIDNNYIKITAKIMEKTKKNFILLYQIINEDETLIGYDGVYEDEIVDCGYTYVEDGKGEISENLFDQFSTDEYSIRINGVYLFDENKTDTLKSEEKYKWEESTQLDGFYEFKQKLSCNQEDAFGIGIAREMIDSKYNKSIPFFIYNGTGVITCEEVCNDKENKELKRKLEGNKITLEDYFPKYTHEIKDFSDDCIKSDLYSIEYDNSMYAEDETVKDDLQEPHIGMTAEQVEKSTWGKPKDINKTTYSWGVKEQWVYSDYRYIYLEDGIVTAIQE